MACPTCDHTMHGIGAQRFWCPRCGTYHEGEGDPRHEAPWIVDRVRQLLDEIPECRQRAFTLGLYECVVEQAPEAFRFYAAHDRREA